MKKFVRWIYACAAVTALAGCAQAPENAGATVSPQAGAQASPQPAVTDEDDAVMDWTVSDRDRDAAYDTQTACTIEFTDTAAVIGGEGAQALGTVVTISRRGDYILSGACRDGRVVVHAGEGDEVRLVFSGLNLASADGNPLLILAADKVYLTLEEGSENRLADAPAYTPAVEDITADAAVYSHCDLTINGEGALTVEGNYKHGIVSKDDLILTGGTLAILAAQAGLEGDDCVKLFGGNLTVSSGTDGIRSDSAEEAARGYVLIDAADIAVTSGTDGIQAKALVSIASGTVQIASGGGSAQGSKSVPGVMAGTASVFEDVSSAKGIQCALDMQISGGTVTVDSFDDALYAKNRIEITGGTVDLSSGDDGLHADLALTVRGGGIRVHQSYKGLEAGQIDVTGGAIYVQSREDGLNAGGGNDPSTQDRMGQGGFAVESSGSIAISGGYLVVNAAGDGLDSIGSLTVSGGVVLVSGPTDSANGALDYGGQAVVSGGLVLAAGSSGMARTFSESSPQGSIQFDLTSAQTAGKTIALCNGDDRVLVSFTPMKPFVNVVFSAPGIVVGETFRLVAGRPDKADGYGFASDGVITGGEELAYADMTFPHYSSGGFFWEGNGAPGG